MKVFLLALGDAISYMVDACYPVKNSQISTNVSVFFRLSNEIAADCFSFISFEILRGKIGARAAKINPLAHALSTFYRGV